MRRKIVRTTTSTSFTNNPQRPSIGPGRNQRRSQHQQHPYIPHHRVPNTMSISPVIDDTVDRMEVDQIGNPNSTCLYANEELTPSCPPMTPVGMGSLAGTGTIANGRFVNMTAQAPLPTITHPNVFSAAAHTPCHMMGGVNNIPAQQVCEYHVGLLEHPVHINTTNCFQAHGITVHHLIGEGNNGAAYYACFYNNCECVIKIGNIDEREFIVAREMGAIGVGPQVVYRSICPVMVPVNIFPGALSARSVINQPFSQQQQQQPQQLSFQPAHELPYAFGRPHEERRIGVDFVVMQRLDMTLLQWLQRGNTLLPVHAMRIHQLFSKAYHAGLIHMDAKSDNIMVRLYNDGGGSSSTLSGGSSDIEQFYMIDFGWSYYAPMHPQDGYDPREYNGWTLATPAHSQTRVAAAWDQLCLFADLQISPAVIRNPSNREFMVSFANLLQLYYSIPPYAFSNMLDYLTRVLPAEGEAIVIAP